MKIKDKKEILQDCQNLLTTILNHNPKKDYVETYIRLSDTEVSYNEWLESQLFGYQNPKTPIRLKNAGVFEEIKKVNSVFKNGVDNEKLSQVLSEALDNTEELSKTDVYDARVYNEGRHVPGLPPQQPKGLQGLYKITMSRFAADDWLVKNGGKKLGSHKLVFHPKDGVTEYRGSEYQFKGKAKALLTFLNNSKNTPFSLDDIKDKCNPNIANSKHFKAAKDTRDTVNYIKKMLKVNKGEFFPIEKHDNNWIWIEK